MIARVLVFALLAGAAVAADEPVHVPSSSRATSAPQSDNPDDLKHDLDSARRDLRTARDELASARGEIDGLRQRVAQLEQGGANGADRASVSTAAADDLKKACDVLSAAAKTEVARLKDLRDEAGQAAAEKLEKAAKALSAAAASLRGDHPTTTKGE